MLDAPFEGALRVLPHVSTIADLNSAAVAKLAESMLSGAFKYTFTRSAAGSTR